MATTVFDQQGNIVQVPGNVPVNDLTQAPIYNEALPPGMLYVPIVVPAKDGTPRLALANPALIATTQEVIDKIAASRQSFVDEGRDRDAQQQVLIDQNRLLLQQQSVLVAALGERKQVINLGDVTLTPTDLVTLIGGELVRTKPVTGLLMTDQLMLTVKSMPPNYGWRGFSIPSNGNLTLRVQAPILGNALNGAPVIFSATAIR